MVALVCTGAALLSLSGAAVAGAPLKPVHYRGMTVRIPQSWPVFNLSAHPSTCVRFDRHALYLGTPGTAERCPAHALGRTEAILLSPLGVSSGLPLEGSVSSYADHAAGVQVTATWWRAPKLVAGALGRSSLPLTHTGTSSTSTRARAAARPAKPPTVFTGSGFDTCFVPSPAQMAAWTSSPYHGIGIYIGGINTGCAQRNISASWVKQELASGWHIAPLYVGPQAPGSTCPRCAMITAKGASGQGLAAATDAVKQARAFDLPSGIPIYYDLEGYVRTKRTTAMVLAFIRAWTRQLHAAGYTSGFYSSALSGMVDLSHVYGTSFPEPDDIWIADWNGHKNTRDAHVPGKDWAEHQRLHQYKGPHNETWDGVTISIDSDVFNGATTYLTPLDGYLVLGSDGSVHPFGTAKWRGSLVGKLASGVRAVALARDPLTTGYWVLTSSGRVDALGAAAHGSLAGKLHGQRVVGLAATPTGGYLILTSSGAVHAFGPAHGYGSDKLGSGVHAVGLAVDPLTGGYWILNSNGGVDAFHAPGYGSPKLHGAKPVAIAAGYGGGYLTLTSSGGVHGFGPAVAYGSDKLKSGLHAVGLETSPLSGGYRILRSDGSVGCFHSRWYGSLKGWLRGGVRAMGIASVSG